MAFFMTWRGGWARGLAVAAAVLLGGGVANANLVTNGNFASYTALGSYNGFEIDGDSGTCTAVTGWTSGNCASSGSTGYNFLFTPTTENTGTGGNPGSYSPQYNNYLRLYDAPTSGSDASNTWNGQGPTAGANFIAMDGDYETAAITQSIGGLTIGKQYALSFNWAGAQQTGYTGATTDAITATLGSQAFSTTALNNVSGGFTGWQTASFTFTATAATEVLSFLAVGTPAVPPFSLLANVDLEAVPEPAAWSLLGLGVLGAAFARMRRRA